MRSFCLWILFVFSGWAQKVEKISLPAPVDITRAEIYLYEPVSDPQAALILCPGRNGSAENLVRDASWQSFAKKNNLALFGLSFASLTEDLSSGRGYTFPDQGSGDLLLKTVRHALGKDVPLLLYGFSSGGYFVELFVEWKPDRVVAWGAHAVGYAAKGPLTLPPGIISCGQEDYPRFGSDLAHFKMGRATGSKLLWIAIPGCQHQWPPRLHQFVQSYFSEILQGPKSDAWVDIDSTKGLSKSEALRQPSLSAWMPAKSLEDAWKNIHQP